MSAVLCRLLSRSLSLSLSLFVFLSLLDESTLLNNGCCGYALTCVCLCFSLS